jgi:hypothetical protein
MRIRRRAIQHLCSQPAVVTSKSQPDAVYGPLVCMGRSLVYSQIYVHYFHHVCQVQLCACFYWGTSCYYYCLFLDHPYVWDFPLLCLITEVQSKRSVYFIVSFHGRMFRWKHVDFCDLESPIVLHPCFLGAAIFRLDVMYWLSGFCYNYDTDYELDPWLR